MDSKLMNWYIDYLGDKTNKRTGAGAPKLMVYDSFQEYLKKLVKEKFCDYGFDLDVILGSLTSLCQPLDVAINKPFKANLCKEWYLLIAADSAGQTNKENFNNEIIDISDDDQKDGINDNLKNNGSNDNLKDNISCDDLNIVLPDKKHERTFRIKVREVLPNKMHDQTFGIKCCQTKIMTRLLELSVTRRIHNWTFGIKTFGIKVREVLPDKKHDWTFGIKCCQTKSMTGLLELSIAR
ncbi:hypothetical protein RclHR1_00110041 [Rhizophagus clarus]|uniref:Uncharacterized protein n=1 Tax=Rhizophagus clarus TaxID=94130 RepID=A0A2Z6QUP3_9GLOM|nr:hypothetical protein RclHR1_00110041 [Rhizophagus clarus]